MLSWSVEIINPLKIPSDSISKGLIFQKFSGGHADPLRFGKLCMPDPSKCQKKKSGLGCETSQIVYFAYNCHAHSNIIMPPAFQNPGSAPALGFI